MKRVVAIIGIAAFLLLTIFYCENKITSNSPKEIKEIIANL